MVSERTPLYLAWYSWTRPIAERKADWRITVNQDPMPGHLVSYPEDLLSQGFSFDSYPKRKSLGMAKVLIGVCRLALVN